MEINYNLTEEDYLNFNMFHVKNSKAVKRTLNMQRFITADNLYCLILCTFKSW